MPDDFSLSSTDTIIRSPALNPPSSQSALPRRAESCFNRSRTRSSTRGRRSLLQGWQSVESMEGLDRSLSAARAHRFAGALLGGRAGEAHLVRALPHLGDVGGR